jgi:CheY-like chemotaxis protein
MSPPGKRVLVVDDNPDVCTSLQLVLDAAGYFVRTATNAREALTMQRHLPADILITDIFMPEADGFEAIGAFRAEFPKTRIVAISGGAQRVHHDFLPAAGLIADATLRKPVQIELLLKKLAEFA